MKKDSEASLKTWKKDASQTSVNLKKFNSSPMIVDDPRKDACYFSDKIYAQVKLALWQGKKNSPVYDTIRMQELQATHNFCCIEPAEKLHNFSL